MFKRPVFLYIFVMIFVFVLSASACQASQLTSKPTATPTPSNAGPPGQASPAGPTPTENILEAVASRTPSPTATPSPIDKAVSRFIDRSGLQRVEFLGLSTEDWVNLTISIALVLFVFIVGGWLFKLLLNWIVQRTRTEVDNRYLVRFANDLRWLLVIATFSFSTQRLSFLGQNARLIISDLTFTLYLVTFVSIGWKLVDFALEWYLNSLGKRPQISRMSGLLVSVRRTVHIILLVIAAIVLMDHLGINITGVAAAFGIIGLAFSLAAQDTLTDAINGYIILLDQPFRIGDRIEIQELGTWGDVVEIGVRTTKIRTLDNRMVIVPNSTIGKNQVVNYTYPDPRYLMQIELGIAYGTDIEKARQLILDTLKKIDGVLEDKPVNVYYRRMGPSAMLFQVTWWINSYENRLSFFDRVNTDLQNALDAAGIEMPYPTYNLNIDPHLDQIQQQPGAQPQRPNLKEME
jgi:MscS family membrane protein